MNSVILVDLWCLACTKQLLDLNVKEEMNKCSTHFYDLY